MKFKINPNKLNVALNIVQKAISTRTTMPVLKCVVIKAYDHQVTFMGTDLQLGIKTSLEAQIETKGEVAVDAKAFAEIIRNIQTPSVEITVTDKKVKITSHDVSVDLRAFSTDDFPVMAIPKAESHIEMKTSELLKLLNQSLFAISETDAMQIISGVLFKYDNQCLHLAASDRFRFALATSTQIKASSNLTTVERVLPGAALKEVKKLLNPTADELLHFAFGDNHALFEIGSTQITSRLLHGRFIQFESIFPDTFSSEMQVERKPLVNALELSNVMTDKSNKVVSLKLSDSQLVVESLSELGSLKKVMPIDKKGHNLKIAFNIHYFSEGIRPMEDDHMSIAFVGGSRGPAVISSSDGSYKYLISPVILPRLN